MAGGPDPRSEAGFAGMPLGIQDVNGTGGFWDCNFHHSGEMPESEEGPWNWPLGKLYGAPSEGCGSDCLVGCLPDLRWVAQHLFRKLGRTQDGARRDAPRSLLPISINIARLRPTLDRPRHQRHSGQISTNCGPNSTNLARLPVRFD